MSRKNARESSMKYLYQLDVLNEEDSTSLEIYFENNEFKEDEIEYIEESVLNILKYKENIDNIISQNIKNWSIERVAKVDLAILRLSIYEILYREDIPLQVSINEAVEISKKYSTEESSRFINGILGGVVDSLK